MITVTKPASSLTLDRRPYTARLKNQRGNGTRDRENAIFTPREKFAVNSIGSYFVITSIVFAAWQSEQNCQIGDLLSHGSTRGVRCPSRARNARHASIEVESGYSSMKSNHDFWIDQRSATSVPADFVVNVS
jgi:hypothetical protein